VRDFKMKSKINIQKKDSKRPVVSPNLMYRIPWGRELMRSSAIHVSFRKLNISPVPRKGGMDDLVPRAELLQSCEWIGPAQSLGRMRGACIYVNWPLASAWKRIRQPSEEGQDFT
jgi:hypothetical protein